MQRPKNRWTAFSIHLAISLLIFLVFLIVITQIWYPGALFTAAGGWQGIKIVAGVDLVLGPLLTLIIYNASKPIKELTRDLSIVAFIQLSCLTAGVYVVYTERPIAVVYAFDTFYTVKQADFIDTSAEISLLEKIETPTPKIVYVKLPQGLSDAKDVVGIHQMLGDPPLQLRTDLYRIMPKKEEQLKYIFRFSLETVNSTCKKTRLITHYNFGTLCYKPDSLGFSQFESAYNNQK